jgi:hypothetical protein
MPKIIALIRRAGLFLLFAGYAVAAEAGFSSVIVADSRHLTGLRAWWANLYNQSHLDFAILTVVAVPLAGSILGLIADYLMGRIGIDLKSRALREN